MNYDIAERFSRIDEKLAEIERRLDKHLEFLEELNERRRAEEKRQAERREKEGDLLDNFWLL